MGHQGRGKLQHFVAITFMVVGTGCNEAADELDDPGGPAISHEDSGVAPPLDQEGMDSLFRRTRLAFRERDGVLRGGDATSGVEITPSGVAVTPYNWPRNAVLDRDRPTDATG